MICDSLEVGPLEVNCFILGCEETRKGIVIDPGGYPEEIIAAVERLKLSILHIINTHGHFDHIGANRAIKERLGADLMIHANDSPMLGRAADIARTYGIHGENSPQPDAFLADGMEIVFGKQLMTVLHTPGHTPGGCCFYFEAEKMVITGDTLFADSIGRTDLPGGSHQQLLKSVRNRLFTLPDDFTAYPGHGPKTTIGHEKRCNPYF
jgi:hydroxyacylglutathione hydrolase